ncbi:FGGY-family carbohydrate kinase [Microbacterium sp. AK031]|uniref:FGGY-family carbohydrate kinase n=1 Tax=Microbacterium sp. AK031 TaxID=2723076 RepID=UPI00216896E4|nr:FGGY-family carbohydrate kinase [Microbacterium sp. AK031]MCS3845054.1 L-xylulokinase [Microbacterium sp. AK031]
MLLGIDSGQTALKVVVFDDDGLEVVITRRPTQTIHPAPHHVERDAIGVVEQLLDAIAEAVSLTPGGGQAITGIGIAAHGDGMYLIGRDGVPTRNAILALDTRAESILERWQTDDTLAKARQLTGQEPFTASLAPLLAWLATHETAILDNTRWLLYCKDWLRYALTGTIATDYVEANSSVGSLDGRSYSTAALREYGLAEFERLLPPPRPASDIAGEILPEIARRTGLKAGTPVAVGTHDVVAAALGAGATKVGDYSILAGTYSVNQYIAPQRVVNPHWQARPWIDGRSWVNMAASPASATNFEWFMQNLMTDTPEAIATANEDVAALGPDADGPFYHPFLYGSPFGAAASGSFLGLRGWHTRAHLIKAVWEGVVHNHRTHMDWLLESATPRTVVSLAGGAARSSLWAQMFADGLNTRVQVAHATEPGALGAAMLAAIATGRFADAEAATTAWARVERNYTPTKTAATRWDEAHARYTATLELARPIWDLLEGQS